MHTETTDSNTVRRSRDEVSEPGRRVPETFPAIPMDRFFPGGHAIGTACGQYVLEFDGRLDERRLQRAVRLSLDEEPFFGCEFVERWLKPCWRRCDDLDRSNAFRMVEVAHDTGTEAELLGFVSEAVDVRRGPQVRVLLLRGTRDTLCVKMHHMVGDARTMMEYVYVLARVYRRLARDPDAVAIPDLRRGRGVRPVAEHVPRSVKFQALRRLRKQGFRRDVYPGPWRFPPVDGSAEPRTILFKRRFTSERVRAISKFARSRLATVSLVFLAAFYRALDQEVDRDPDRPVVFGTPVDLRTYHLPEEAPIPLGNVVGAMMMRLNLSPGAAFDDVLGAMRAAFKSQSGAGIGLSTPVFLLEAFRPLTALFECIPYGLIKWQVERNIAARLARGDAGIAILSSIGNVDPQLADFEDADLADVYGFGGVPNMGGTVVLALTGCRGAYNVAAALREDRIAPAIVNAILDRMDRELSLEVAR